LPGEHKEKEQRKEIENLISHVYSSAMAENVRKTAFINVCILRTARESFSQLCNRRWWCGALLTKNGRAEARKGIVSWELRVKVFW
jgi:hypothetical protein